MQIDRRAFLTASVAAGITTIAGRSAARAAPHIDRGFARSLQIAEGVYATLADPQKGLQCYSNGGVIAGRDATLIIEGHYQKEGAELEIELAHAVSKAPIRGVIDTHWHLDHTFGNVGYAAKGIPILAHDHVGSLMKQLYAPRPANQRAAFLAPWEKRLADATDPVDKTHKSGDLQTYSWMFDAVNSGTLALPTEGLAPASLPRTIDLGGLTAVIEFHPGHSTTDLIIKVPERDLVFAGDLSFPRALPVFADSDFMAWRKVLDLFAGFPRSTRFVPGHGAVSKLEQVHEQAALMDDMRHHAEQMKRMGASVDEAERRYVLPKGFRDVEVFGTCWNFTVGGAMRTAYESLA